MLEQLLDSPMVTSMLFYPRPARPGTSSIPNTRDGTFQIAEGVHLGWRLFRPADPASVILFFHGNGEIAADYDPLAPLFFGVNAALLVVDYRGYGWSSGRPLTSALTRDAEAIMPTLPDALGDLAARPLFVMGRSLGSAPASHLAWRLPERFRGVILESAFSDMPSVVARLGLPIPLPASDDLPLNNVGKIAQTDLPLLVIHGEQDQLLPVENGQRLYDASPAPRRTILRVPGAGHNDVMVADTEAYFGAIREFISGATV
jgi:hypothetical protein